MTRSLLLAISAGLVFTAFGTAAPRPLYMPPTHTPAQPKSGQNVKIGFRCTVHYFAKVAVLQLQAVPPGEYIRRSDPDFKKKWGDLPMPSEPEQATSIERGFIAQIPGDQIKHRWLYRYRVVVTKQNDEKQYFPSREGNYAFFCYDGVPAWSGAREPGKTPERKFSAEFLNTIKPYHLIARAEDIATSQWNGGAHKKRFPATFVYDGQVYDHMEFSNRGQGSAYISGKNKWALKFPPPEENSHELRDYPRRMPHHSDFDMNPGQHTPYIPVLRGVAGLDEALTFRAYQLAGVPSSSTHWVHWRVIDSAHESNPKDQYDSDLWGLYLGLDDLDQELLKKQKFPDGLIVSIQSGIKHLPDDMSAGQKEWDAFRGGMHSNPPEDWWRKNLDLPKYYSFHALNRLLGNVDIRPDGNHGYYRAPDGKWSPLPWDNDMCFVPRHHQPGHIDAIRCLDHARIKREYQNRAREILDLFAADASPTGGQVGQLVADLTRVLSPAGFETNWAQLDEAAWNWRPQFNQKGSYFVNPAYGDHFGGRWERKLVTNDIKGFEKYLLEFCTDSRPTKNNAKNYAPNDGNPQGYGWGYVAHEAFDREIPPKPTIKRIGMDAQFRTFEVEQRTWADGKKPVIEWRVGRMATQGIEGWKTGDPYRYELTEHWRTPANDLRNDERGILSRKLFAESGTYRVRARYHDAAGRASHWSEPIVEVVAGK